MKKLIIFDFDGTMVDTVIDVSKCFNEALSHFGFKTYPVEKYRKVVGGNLETMFHKLLDEENRTQENIEKLKKKYREVYLAYDKPNTKLFDGIEELIYNLKKDGFCVAINTNKAQNLVEDLCEKIFLGIKFDSIIGYLDGRQSKPNPCGVYEIMRMNKVGVEDTVYIGDGGVDIQTAKNAGIDLIFVTWGQGDESLLKSESVLFVAKHPEEILRFLQTGG